MDVLLKVSAYNIDTLLIQLDFNWIFNFKIILVLFFVGAAATVASLK